MPTETELFNLICERYDLYELLELVGIEVGEFLTIWDGWVGNPDILEDLGFVVKGAEEDEVDS